MFRKILMFVIVFVIGASASVAHATHSWGGYHWARTANPFTLKLGDNVSSNWDSVLATTSADWSVSSVLNTIIVTGSTNPKNCKAITGRVEVCNSKYGNNGWLGIAQVWISGLHITKGVTKLNDTYFNTARYNTPEWRNLVMCQEVGHTLGLDHQDEDFGNDNLGTCMDYTSNPILNQHPNLHDYTMLEDIYAHLDSTTTLSQTITTNGKAEVDHNDQSTWGKAIRTGSDGKPSLFARELTSKEKVFTFVIWAKE